MPVYLDKIDIKLNAILAKNLDEIIAKKTYIPSLGSIYTKLQLQTWLDKRIAILNKVKTLTTTQIDKLINTVLKTLSVSDKLIADKIIAGTDYSITDIEAFIEIILYKFAITTEVDE